MEESEKKTEHEDVKKAYSDWGDRKKEKLLTVFKRNKEAAFFANL